jgi:hypothetical protein
MSSLKKYGIYYFLLFCILFLISLCNSQNPFQGFYERFDSTVYQYIGKMILDGKVPYRDIFDHKGPIAYLWHALGYAVNPMWGQWLIELIILLISGILAFKIAKNYISPLNSFLILAVVFLFIPKDDTIGNTESLSVFILFICMYIFNNYLLNGTLKYKDSLIIGICCSALLLIKPTYLILPGIFILVVLYDFIKRKEFQLLLLHILWFLSSFLLINFLILFWLFYNNALNDFINDYILFNYEYVKYWQNHNSRYFVFNVFIKNKIIIASLITILITLLGYKRFNRHEKIFLGVLSCAFIITFISIILPNNPFEHYVYVVFPISFVLFVLLFKLLGKYANYLSFVLPIIVFMGIMDSYSFIFNRKYDPNISYTAKLIDTTLEDGGTFQTFGWDMGRLHLLSNHDASTIYAISGMMERLYPEKLFDDIKRANPSIVVILAIQQNTYENILHMYWPDFFDKYIPFIQNDTYQLFKFDKYKAI